jgi:hypothetical protein
MRRLPSSLSRWLSRSAALCSVLTVSWNAAATPHECIAQHTQALDLRRESKLLAAKGALSACTRDETCPGEVARECAALLEQLATDIPSVVFAALDARGQDTTDVKVFVNDQLVLEQLGLEAVEFDPGRYTLRFEGAGGAIKNETMILRWGERNRRILVDFRPPAVAQPGPALPLPSPPPAPPSTRRTSPVASLVLGGVGLLGLGAFGYFAYDGKREQSDMTERGGCAVSAGGPGCSRDQVDHMRRSYLIADISLGVGVASLGAAAVVFFTSRGSDGAASSSSRPRFVAAPLPGGLALGARGSF